MLTLLLLPLLAHTVLAQSTIQYVVHNYCPTPINLYIGGTLDSVLPVDGSTTKFLGPTEGFFYTDTNGGNRNGSATRAGFYLTQGYYYLVKDTAHFNTGLSIQPRAPQTGGFCATAECDTVNCTTAYTSPPLGYPTPSSTPPSPPLHACNVQNVTYDITFCPTRGFPGQPAARRIHPNVNHPTKCLDVQGGVFTNGTPVQIYDCNGTPAQNWNIQRRSTKVRLAGTNFCLDAGTAPANGVKMKIWQCYDNLPAQQWFYTGDNRIALEGQGQCLDLTNGNLTNGNLIQIYQCTDNNTNQIWSL